jgi:DNA-binding NarL/FixJ family response regulator
VAADLQITQRTIKMHRASIFEKLEVAETARLAVDLGIEPLRHHPEPWSRVPCS